MMRKEAAERKKRKKDNFSHHPAPPIPCFSLSPKDPAQSLLSASLARGGHGLQTRRQVLPTSSWRTGE